MASSIFERKILPSPILPFEAVLRMTSTELGHRVVEHHLKLDLGKQVDIVFLATIRLGVAFLASLAADLKHGHAVNAGFDQRFFGPPRRVKSCPDAKTLPNLVLA